MSITDIIDPLGQEAGATTPPSDDVRELVRELKTFIGSADTWSYTKVVENLATVQGLLAQIGSADTVHEAERTLLDKLPMAAHQGEVRKTSKLALDMIGAQQQQSHPPTETPQAQAQAAGDKPKPTPFSAAKPYTLAELEKEDVKLPEFIVSGLLPVGLSVLAAPPKTGKSWLVIDMLDCICGGKPFWGRQTMQSDCLYCDLEGSKSRLKERFRRLGISEGWTNRFHIVHSLPPMGEELLVTLQLYMHDIPDLKVIVIDTVGRIKQGARRGENSYESDTRNFGILQQLAIQRGIAIVCITHLRKNGSVASDDDPFERITGSMGLMGVADSAWLIAGQRDSVEKTFVATGRDMESVKAVVSLNDGDCRWTYRGDADQIARQEADAAYESNPIVQTLRELMRQSNGKGWEGSGEDLLTAVKDYAHALPTDGNTPISSGKGMAEALKHLQVSLCKRDRLIIIIPDKPTWKEGKSRRLFKVIPMGE